MGALLGLGISVLQGPVQAARVLNVKGHRHQTAQSWLRNRVPAEYCPAIERETRARGKPVVCEELRPDVAWDVLRLQSAEPAPCRKVGQKAGGA